MEIGARSVAITILGNLAYWNGRHLRWAPAKWECGRCRGLPLARPRAPRSLAASGHLNRGGRGILTRTIPGP